LTILQFPGIRPGRFLSFENVGQYDPYAYDPCGMEGPFSFIPALPGVIALGAPTGRATVIEACLRSMRQRAREHWMGFEGASTVSATFIAYEASNFPTEREALLIKEHRACFGQAPIFNRA
jgi:hypothetical protein